MYNRLKWPLHCVTITIDNEFGKTICKQWKNVKSTFIFIMFLCFINIHLSYCKHTHATKFIVHRFTAPACSISHTVLKLINMAKQYICTYILCSIWICSTERHSFHLVQLSGWISKTG